jgi:type I restriction enzyme S subunit
MSEVLPKGWVKSTFGILNQHKSRNIDPRKFPDELFELYSVPSFPSKKPEILKGSDIGSSKQYVEHGDVLVCKINPRINRVWVVGPKGKYQQIASSEWIIFRSPELEPTFFLYQYSANNFRELICKDVTGVGGSLTRAQPKRVASFPVYLPPSNEQKRIAEKLEQLLTAVDATINRLDKVPTILKRFRQSVLAAAFRGDLTSDWPQAAPGHSTR